MALVCYLPLPPLAIGMESEKSHLQYRQRWRSDLQPTIPLLEFFVKYEEWLIDQFTGEITLIKECSFAYTARHSAAPTLLPHPILPRQFEWKRPLSIYSSLDDWFIASEHDWKVLCADLKWLLFRKAQKDDFCRSIRKVTLLCALQMTIFWACPDWCREEALGNMLCKHLPKHTLLQEFVYSQILTFLCVLNGQPWYILKGIFSSFQFGYITTLMPLSWNIIDVFFLLFV